MYLTLDEPLITSIPSSGGGAGVNQPHVPHVPDGQRSDDLSGGNLAPSVPRCHDRDTARHGSHLPIKVSIRAARSSGRTPKKKARYALLYLTAWPLLPLQQHNVQSIAITLTLSGHLFRRTRLHSSRGLKCVSSPEWPKLKWKGDDPSKQSLCYCSSDLEHRMKGVLSPALVKLGRLLTTSMAGWAWEAGRSARPIRC